MRRSSVLAAFLVLAATVVLPVAAQRGLYDKALDPKGFAAQAIILPTRSIGATVLRAKPALAVEVLVEVEDYLPRALEPVLLINEKPVTGSTRVVGVEGRMTTLGFLIEEPGLFQEGATLHVQMGDEANTRALIPGTLSRDRIRLLPDDVLKRQELPMLHEWLGQKS